MHYRATGELPDGLDDESVDGPLLKDNPDAFCSDDERTFIGSRRWMARFLRQYNLSLCTPHSRRWPTVDPKTIKEFNVRICDPLRLDEPWLVLNKDETFWKLINMNIKTIAERGPDVIACWFPGDPKYSVTAISVSVLQERRNHCG